MAAREKMAQAVRGKSWAVTRPAQVVMVGAVDMAWGAVRLGQKKAARAMVEGAARAGEMDMMMSTQVVLSLIHI